MSCYSRALRMGVPSQPASSADASSVGERTTSAYDDGLSTFMSVRPRVFGIVYRMLRSAAEAQDVLQASGCAGRRQITARFGMPKHSS